MNSFVLIKRVLFVYFKKFFIDLFLKDLYEVFCFLPQKNNILEQYFFFFS